MTGQTVHNGIDGASLRAYKQCDSTAKKILKWMLEQDLSGMQVARYARVNPSLISNWIYGRPAGRSKRIAGIFRELGLPKNLLEERLG